jgi:DNA-binding winged helix-turn-helix (wHTH) protein/tetratricopeptide (TPR) repeat protein
LSDSAISDGADDFVVRLARERPFRLGAVDVRPATREVIGPRGRQVVEPRVMQVLVALAQAKGEVLTRDDLTARCWDGRIVGEDAISRVISHLRRLSEGLGRDGWTLETVTKVGYRLIPSGQAREGPTAPAVSDSPPPSSRRLILGGALGAAATAAIGTAGYFAWRARTPSHARAKLLLEKGVEALRQGSLEQNAQAVAFLREAVGLAPGDADAWGALALAYHSSLLYTPPQRQPGVFAQASAAARRALELDPDNPRGAAAMALLTPVYRNWRAAETVFERAMRLYPGEPLLAMAYNRLLLGVGRMREAVPFAQLGVGADGFAPFYRHALAQSLWGAGRIEEAEIELGKARTRWPRHYALWFLQFYLWAHTGRADRAVAMGADMASRPIGIPDADIEISLTGARAMAGGVAADIDRATEIQLAAARRGVGYAENAMSWLSGFGRLDDAFAVARAMYFAEGFSIALQRFSQDQGRYLVARRYATHHLFMPAAAAMRRDRRWPKLMTDLGIADYWRATGRRPDDPAWARGA